MQRVFAADLPKQRLIRPHWSHRQQRKIGRDHSQPADMVMVAVYDAEVGEQVDVTWGKLIRRRAKLVLAAEGEKNGLSTRRTATSQD